MKLRNLTLTLTTTGLLALTLQASNTVASQILVPKKVLKHNIVPMSQQNVRGVLGTGGMAQHEEGGGAEEAVNPGGGDEGTTGGGDEGTTGDGDAGTTGGGADLYVLGGRYIEDEDQESWAVGPNTCPTNYSPMMDVLVYDVSECNTALIAVYAQFPDSDMKYFETGILRLQPPGCHAYVPNDVPVTHGYFNPQGDQWHSGHAGIFAAICKRLPGT